MATAPRSQLSERDRALGGNPFAGFMLVLRNPYLLGIALFIAGISAINTFLYFEQLELVEEQFEELTEAHAGVRQPRRHRAGAGGHHAAFLTGLHRHAPRASSCCW